MNLVQMINIWLALWMLMALCSSTKGIHKYIAEYVPMHLDWFIWSENT